MMSANVGVALMLVARPSTFTDPSTSHRVRDAVHASVFTPDVFGTRTAPDGSAGGQDDARLQSTASRLNALLRQSPDQTLSVAETVLLTEWLDRLSNTPSTGRHRNPQVFSPRCRSGPGPFV